MSDILDAEVVSDETTFVPDLDHIPFCGVRTGWCMDGNHAPNEHSRGCPVVIGGNRYPDPSRKGVFYTTPKYRCPCDCHTRPVL